MKNKIYTIILIALAIISLSKLKTYWDNRKDVITSPILTEAENSKDIIDVKNKTVTIVTRDGAVQKKKVIRGVRHIAYTEKLDGTIERKIINRGFTFEPGLFIGSDSKDALIGLDTQLFYWSEFGLVSGVGIPIGGMKFNKLRLHMGASYSLARFKLGNTSLYAGADTSKSIVFGLRVAF